MIQTPQPQEDEVFYPPVKLLKDEFFPDSPLKERRKLRNQKSELQIITHHKHERSNMLKVEEEYQISPTVEYQTMMKVSSRRRNYGSLKQRKKQQLDLQKADHFSYSSIGDIKCYQDNFSMPSELSIEALDKEWESMHLAVANETLKSLKSLTPPDSPCQEGTFQYNIKTEEDFELDTEKRQKRHSVLEETHREL